jgi:hypothetical protein
MIKVNLLPGKKKVKMPQIPIGTILGILIILGVSYYLFYVLDEEYKATLRKLDDEIERLNRKKKAVLGEKEEKRQKLSKE